MPGNHARCKASPVPSRHSLPLLSVQGLERNVIPQRIPGNSHSFCLKSYLTRTLLQKSGSFWKESDPVVSTRRSCILTCANCASSMKSGAIESLSVAAACSFFPAQADTAGLAWRRARDELALTNELMVTGLLSFIKSCWNELIIQDWYIKYIFLTTRIINKLNH